jgi:phage repressor protein C with HTH and peptisase S24 domain
MYTYDKKISESQESYGSIKHISYNKIIAIDKINNFIDCPANMPSASICLKVPDNSMEPRFKNESYVFVEFNSLLENNDVGLFSLNGNVLIRKFQSKKEKIILKPINKNFEDILVNQSDDFYIIGKILN